MVDAYLTLQEADYLDLPLVLRLGHVVQPDKNPVTQWRQVNVMVGHSKKAPWQEVPRLMESWLEAVDDMFAGADGEGFLDATEAYREFEEIHPFRDGNGRVGNILYNYLNATFAAGELVFPPNLWNDPRREGIQL
jgi:hypothetical protein